MEDESVRNVVEETVMGGGCVPVLLGEEGLDDGLATLHATHNDTHRHNDTGTTTNKSNG